jgi:hypothetical protein
MQQLYATGLNVARNSARAFVIFQDAMVDLGKANASLEKVSFVIWVSTLRA